MLKIEELQSAAIKVLRHQRPDIIPLPGLLLPLKDWFEGRHIELMKEAGFPDARRAFNAIFINLSAEGNRLTELAAKAGMSKQAMSELIDDMVEKEFLVRIPDPSDGRAKLILWAPRGLAAHVATMKVFAKIESELEATLGGTALAELRESLSDAVKAVSKSKFDA